MVRNEEKRAQALSLRQRGFTLEEIARYCDIAKSTASKWLRGQAFSVAVTKQNKARAGAENAKRLKLINKARGAERTARYREVVRAAEVSFKHYKRDPLFIAGLMLYSSAGDNKNPRLVRIAGARPEIHRIFIRFALEYLGVEKEKIKFWLLLYQDLDEQACMKKWHQATTLPYRQFYKNQVIASKSTKQTLQYGVGNTIIGSTVLKCTLSTWIALATKELTK